MRALKARGQSRDTLPYKAILQPYFAWYGLGFNILIVITQGFTAFMPWNTSSFFTAYISLILFVLLYVGHKLWFRTPFVKPIEADLDTVRREIDAMELDGVGEKPAPTTVLGKIWSFIVG